MQTPVTPFYPPTMNMIESFQLTNVSYFPSNVVVLAKKNLRFDYDDDGSLGSSATPLSLSLSRILASRQFTS